MNATELQAIKESILKKMDQEFQDKGELMPKAILIETNGNLIVIPNFSTTNVQKDIFISIVKATCKAREISAVALISESYLVIRANKEGEKEKILASGNASAQPDKIDSAILSFQSRQFDETIIFKADTKNRILEEIQRFPNKGEGLYCEFLQPIN